MAVKNGGLTWTKTHKARLIGWINGMSSGTIAQIIGSSKYAIIDRAACTVSLHVSEKMTEADCEKVQTFDDLCNLFKTTWEWKKLDNRE